MRRGLPGDTDREARPGLIAADCEARTCEGGRDAMVSRAPRADRLLTPSRRAVVLPREWRGAAAGVAARAPVAAKELTQLKATPSSSSRVACGPRSPCTLPKRADHRLAPGREVSARRPSARERPTPATSACSSVVTLSDPRSSASKALNSESPFAATGPSPSAYLVLLHQCLPPEKLTKRENRLKGKIVVALSKLNNQIQEAQTRQNSLLEENKQLQTEKHQVEAESKFILNYLTEKSKQREKKCEELWKDYFQQYRELEQKKQELASRYGKETSDLKAQLLRGEKVQSKLEQQLQTLRNIATIKERQDGRIQSLQEQIEMIPTQTYVKDQEAHFQFLQQKAFLEQEIKELDLVRAQLRERKRRELGGKAQALECLAQKSHFEFCHAFCRENQQLRKKLKPLLQEAQKLEAMQSWLENQKRQLKQSQWCQEAIRRARQGGQYRWDCSLKQ